MKVLPQAIATPNIHIGIIAGKLNGVMPAHDAQRLAHRIDVDARPGALGVFALQRVRDAAGELDHLQPALHVAARIGHAPCRARDESSSASSSMCASTSRLNSNITRARRWGLIGGPGGLRPGGGLHGKFDLVEARERNLGLDLAGVGIEHVA